MRGGLPNMLSGLGAYGSVMDYYVNACASCPLLSPSWPSLSLGSALL